MRETESLVMGGWWQEAEQRIRSAELLGRKQDKSKRLYERGPAVRPRMREREAYRADVGHPGVAGSAVWFRNGCLARTASSLVGMEA